MAISQALLDAQKRAADRATAQGGTISNAYTKSIPTPAQPAPAPIQPQTQQPQMTSDQLFSGIVSGQYTPSQTDPGWTSMYQGGGATPEQKAAYQRYTQANALVDQIKAGQVAPDQNNPQWQAMYQNGQPTQAQQDAYKIWDNLVKTGKVQTNNLGIPNTMPKVSGTTDVTGKTIPLSQLKNANAGYVDLKNMLGASINGDNLLNGIDNQTAGLLALYGQSTAQDKEAMAIQDKLLKAMESMGMQAQDIQSAMDQQGVGAAYEQVKQLSLKAAQLQGELEKFDVNTMQATENVGNQPIADVFVTGQQAQVNRQRSLERLSRSAELSAVIGLQQAYKGNAELGIELATKSVDLKYAPIMNQINTLQTQLGFANEKATKADQKRADVIKSLLDIKLKKVEEEKATQLEIQKIAIEAAVNGAPLNVVNQMRSAADPASAAALGANYIKGSLESIGENATPQFNVNAGGIPSSTTGNITVSAGTTQNRPDRNNNPLNIKVPGAGIEEARRRYNDPGATIDPVPATDGGQFIKFSDPNVGVQAAVTLLRMGYNNLEVGAAMKRWSGSGYGSEIAPQYAGRTIGNLTDSELADLVVRMAKREGFTGKVGGTTPASGNVINGVDMGDIKPSVKNDLLDDISTISGATSRDEALQIIKDNLTVLKAKYGDKGIEILKKEIDKKFPPSQIAGPDIIIDDVYSSLFK